MNHDNASLLRRQPKGRRQSLGNGNTKVKYQLTINRRKTNLYVYLVLAIILHAHPGCFPKTNQVCSPLQPLLLCLVKHRQDCAQTDDNKFSTSSYQCVQSKQRGYSRIKTKAKPCRNSSESTLERMAKNTEGQKQTKPECKRHTTKSVAWLPQTKTSVHGRQPDGQAKTGEPIGQAALLRLVATTHVIL